VLTNRAVAHIEAPAANTLTLGVLGGYFTAMLDADVRAAFDDAIERCRAAGVRMSPRSVAGTETIIETYVNISLAEAAHWHAPTLDAHAADYQPPVRERLEMGRKITAVKYLAARDTRDTLRGAVDAAHDGCDALVLPTLPIVAPLLGAANVTMDADGAPTLTVRAAMLRLTQLFNMTGHPAISIPIPAPGLPVGLQLVGRRDATEELLAVAMTCERVLSRGRQGARGTS
jgi:aspartyl-tRNA(Asn)/glutamyl-tRNA(Gln) amidotransferase subunit A